MLTCLDALLCYIVMSCICMLLSFTRTFHELTSADRWACAMYEWVSAKYIPTPFPSERAFSKVGLINRAAPRHAGSPDPRS